ncbi:MAG: cytochrome P450 [Halioglobus sp.]|nr:cytochrome P450 [Halioglobus sp.]
MPAHMIDWYYDTLPGERFAAELHALRPRGDIVPVLALGGEMPVHYIISHGALADAFRDGEHFPPGHAYQIISLPFIGETFMSMNEDRHRQWRPPMTPSFRRSAVDRMDQHRLAAIGYELLDELEGRGKLKTVDLVPEFTRRYAFRVICDQLGLPIEDERHYYQWSMDLMFGGRDLAASQAADAQVTAMAQPVFEARRQEPRDDQISRWVHSTVVKGEMGEVEITDESILAHIRLFFTAGATTTSDAMGNLFHALLTHPEAWRQCVEEPASQEGAIQELLRWNPPVAAQPRFTRPDREVQVSGVTIPPNSAVLFGIAAANRDPAVFPDPDRFDITRDTKTLLTFGPGLRTCPGMHLAQKNLNTALRIMAERFPDLALAAGAEAEPEGILLRGINSLPVRLH